MSPPVPAAGRPLAVHASTPRIGGAEASLLAALAAEPPPAGRPLFIVPAEGPLARAASERGWDVLVLPWPEGFAALTQTRWLALLALPGFLPYLFRLRAAVRGAERIWSSGAKSHAACLALLACAPGLRSRILFDVRDFLRSGLLREAIATAARLGCRVAANSRAVAAAYPGAEVRYPRVALARPAVSRRSEAGPRIVTHLAYFAPYKGQDLFLRCARALVDAGVEAEFWVIGDVIYPAVAYARYREEVYALAARSGLGSKVRFLGNLPAGEVQERLERTHLLLHCTREPEPFGRAVMEAMLCGCEAICHRGSGVCEVASVREGFPEWAAALRTVLGEDYVRLALPGAA